jgi:hypothetical protein
MPPAADWPSGANEKTPVRTGAFHFIRYPTSPDALCDVHPHSDNTLRHAFEAHPTTDVILSEAQRSRRTRTAGAPIALRSKALCYLFKSERLKPIRQLLQKRTTNPSINVSSHHQIGFHLS